MCLNGMKWLHGNFVGCSVLCRSEVSTRILAVWTGFHAKWTTWLSPFSRSAPVSNSHSSLAVDCKLWSFCDAILMDCSHLLVTYDDHCFQVRCRSQMEDSADIARLGTLVVRASDSWSRGLRFNSHPLCTGNNAQGKPLYTWLSHQAVLLGADQKVAILYRWKGN